MLTHTQIKSWLAAGLVVAVATQVPAGAVAANAAAGDAAHALAGLWKAAEYKVAASGDLDVTVWGRGASKVRNVELVLEPGGAGVLRVNTSVVDAKGVTKPYSASVVEARLKVEMPTSVAAGLPVMPTVTVLDAEERYLDGTHDHRKVDGLTVSIHLPSPDSRMLNLRYDTAQGTGSFGESLTRRTGTSAVAGKGAGTSRG